MDPQAVLSTPTIPRRHTEIPNTPDIPTPLSRATTQSWDSQNGPRPSPTLSSESLSPLLLFSPTPLHRNLETLRDKRIMIKTALLFNIPYKEIYEKLDVTNKQI